MTRVRSDMVQAQHGPRGRRSADFLKRVGKVSAVIKEDKATQGTVLAFSTAPKMPAILADLVKDDRRWAWVPTLGGLIRLADAPYEGGTEGLCDLEAGDFFQDGSKGRLPGFGASQHPQWGWIKVRLPSDQALMQAAGVPTGPDSVRIGMDMDAFKELAKKGPPTSRMRIEPVDSHEDTELIVRTKARDLMFELPGYTTAHRDWAMEAPIAEVKQWLAKAREGGAR